MLQSASITAGRTRRVSSRRRGSMMIYSIYIMLVSCAIISVAVDYGRIQMIKSQEQRSADAVARGLLASLLADASLIQSMGMTYAQAAPYTSYYGVDTRIENANPVDANSGVRPTYQITWGSWYNSSFHADSGAVGPLAVQVIVSRTAGNNNAVPLAFPLPNGKTFISKTCDVWAKATAVLPNTVAIGETIQATQDPWLAGMPVGSAVTSDDDYVTNNSVTASTNPSNGYDANTTINVTPGATITWNIMNPHMSHVNPPVYFGADGDTSNIYNHLKDGRPGDPTYSLGNGGQNGIGDIESPIDAIIGVFLDSSAPNSSANSAYATYANAHARSYTSDYNDPDAVTGDLHLQQPFWIGDGKNSAGTKRSFIVPANATRLFLGMMDGYEWSNNSGYFSVSGTEQPPIQMVQ